MHSSTKTAVLAACFSVAKAISLDVTSSDSLTSAAKTIASDIMSIYSKYGQGEGIGLFSDPGQPYYFWENGAAWNSILQYWAITGDDQYNDQISAAFENQMGPNSDFMPSNETKTEGNDDQAIWALAAMTAAEYNFTSSGSASWLNLSQTVFNEQVRRWDSQSCKGGLRWQIYAFNQGYDIKNTASNGAFFELAARLYQYSGNQTYADWAEKSFAWAESIGLIDSNGAVYDSASTSQNCSQISKIRWTINSAHYMYGSAVMYNITSGNSTWESRTSNIVTGTALFFNRSNIMSESACESNGACQTDQIAYRSILARAMGLTANIAPATHDAIAPVLATSATAAGKSCTGGSGGNSCGSSWTKGKYDGSTGLGQELSALEIIQANLVVNGSVATVTNGNGTTPTGTTSAGASASASASGTGSASVLTWSGQLAGGAVLTSFLFSLL